MELNREHFHAIFFCNFRCGLTQLNSIFGTTAPSRTSVYQWYGEFNGGLSPLQDEFCEGHSKSLVVPEANRQLILQERHMTYCEIETTLGIQYCMNI